MSKAIFKVAGKNSKIRFLQIMHMVQGAWPIRSPKFKDSRNIFSKIKEKSRNFFQIQGRFKEEIINILLIFARNTYKNSIFLMASQLPYSHPYTTIYLLSFFNGFLIMQSILIPIIIYFQH